MVDGANPWERADLKAVHLDDRATLGPADAPVTIIEFGDFECPYCAHAFNEIETVVNTTYKGRVHLIWKNFPLNVHPWAEQGGGRGGMRARAEPGPPSGLSRAASIAIRPK